MWTGAVHYHFPLPTNCHCHRHCLLSRCPSAPPTVRSWTQVWPGTSRGSTLPDRVSRSTKRHSSNHGQTGKNCLFSLSPCCSSSACSVHSVLPSAGGLCRGGGLPGRVPDVPGGHPLLPTHGPRHDRCEDIQRPQGRHSEWLLGIQVSSHHRSVLCCQLAHVFVWDKLCKSRGVSLEKLSQGKVFP